jgi:protein tyrosine kinase modulator
MQNNPTNLTPAYIIDVILRRRWLIIIPFCLAMLAGIFYALRAPKIYEASTLILIEPQRVPENYVQSIVENDPSARIRTISEQVNSRTNIERIIHDFHLFSGTEYENMFMEDKLERIRRRISVNVNHSGSQRGNEISSFSISYRGKDPDKTMKIANTLATFLISENLRNRESQAESTSEFLNEELGIMRERLVEVEGKLKDYRKQYMGELPEQLETNLAILERLQEQLSDRHQSLRDERNQLAVVEQLIASPPPPTQMIEGQAPPAMGESSDLDVLKEQLAISTSKYTQKHPDVIKIKKMIADLEDEAAMASESEMANTETSPQGDQIHPTPGIRDENYRRREEIRLASRTLETEILELENQIAFYQNRVESTPKREQELASVQRDYENIQLAYNSLLERKLEADIAVNMEKKQKGEQFQILDSAKLPQRPVEPDMQKIFLIFLAAGFGIGGVIIFLLEHLDTSIRRFEDIESLGVDLLTTIPVIVGWKDRALKRSHQLLSAVSVLITVSLFAGFFLLTYKGEDAVYRLVGKFIQF